MGSLRGHATDPPGRWKEPRAFAAADHTAQRADQGRGRRSIRRRVSRQCAWRCGPAGSLIPHAGAIRALVIPMIEPAFRTETMAPARRSDRVVAGGSATRARAIRMATITRRADREEAVTTAAGFLAKRRVHDVGAASRADWTRPSNHGTTKTTGSVRRSIEAVTEGLEGSAPGPHLRFGPQLTRPARDRSMRRGCGRCRSRGRTERVHRCLEISLKNARFPQRPQPLSFFLQKRRTKNTYDDDCSDLRGFT